MEFTGLLILKALWLYLPIGLANMAPVFFRKAKFLAIPIDFKFVFSKEPLFGSHKTWRGLVTATLTGGLAFWLQQYLYQFSSFQKISLIEYPAFPVWTGFMVGLGVILGDLVKSFFKRRLRIQPGHHWIIFDQIDYIIGGLVFYSFFVSFSWQIVVIIFAFGFLLTVLTNHLGFYLKIKETKW